MRETTESLYQHFCYRTNVCLTRETCFGVREWCVEQFGIDGYTRKWDWNVYYLSDNKRLYYSFFFMNDEDMSWFLLKWGDYHKPGEIPWI